MEFVDAFLGALRERNVHVTNVIIGDFPPNEVRDDIRYSGLFVSFAQLRFVNQLADSVCASFRMQWPILERMDASIVDDGIIVRATVRYQGE